MKVAIDIRPLGERIHSGVQEYTVNLLLEIFSCASKQDRFILFSTGRKFRIASERFRAAIERKDNVVLRHVGLPSKLINLSFWLLPSVSLENYLGNPDVFFAPNINFFPHFKEAKTVLTVHDLSFCVCPRFFSSDRRRWHRLVRPQERVRKVHKIIAASHSTKWDLQEEYSLPAKKIEVIYSGVDNSFRPLPPSSLFVEKVCAKYGLPPQFILYLGTIEPRKNVLSIIEAFEALEFKQKNLVLAGPKGWNYRGVLRKIDQSSFKKNIHVIGPCKPEERVAFYNRASAVVYPSFLEGFGFPPLEAMACGTPAVVSNYSSFPEVVGNAALMVDPRRAEEISQALAKILTDSRLRKVLTRKGLRRAKKFSWKDAATKTYRLFKTIS